MYICSPGTCPEYWASQRGVWMWAHCAGWIFDIPVMKEHNYAYFTYTYTFYKHNIFFKAVIQWHTMNKCSFMKWGHITFFYHMQPFLFRLNIQLYLRKSAFMKTIEFPAWAHKVVHHRVQVKHPNTMWPLLLQKNLMLYWHYTLKYISPQS